MSNCNINKDFEGKNDNIYDTCCDEKDFKFENKEDEEIFYNYDYLDLGLSFSCIVEDYFFNKIILNYWLLIKKINHNSICFINETKFYFYINPINSYYFEVILVNLTNSPNLLYRDIHEKNSVINITDILIHGMIRLSYNIYKFIYIKLYYFLLHQQLNYYNL